MNSRGRPRVSEVQLRDGFYIEVCNKGTKKGMKIRKDSKEDMLQAASQYASYKDVIVLGEYRDGTPLKEIPLPK